jgi:hypothetical protein
MPTEQDFERILIQQAQEVGRKMLDELEGIRKEHGDEVYLQSVADAIAALKAQGPRGEQLARMLFKDIDPNLLPKPTEPVMPGGFIPGAPPPPEPPPEPPPLNADMAQSIMDQIPGLRSQAQFNVTMAAFDALRLLLGSIFTGDREGAEKASKALEGVIEAARQATIITNNLRDVPEAAKGGDEFRKAPIEVGEYDRMKALLAELEGIVTKDGFAEWYKTNRARFDEVKSQSLRNTLFDAIRAKKDKLSDAAS